MQDRSRLRVGCFLCSITDEVARSDREYVLLHEAEHWVVVLAPNQSLLGRSIVRLRRHAESVGELADGELLELRDLAARLERALKAAFGATMFNWSCYMNLAYRNDPPDPHVHWWCVPRYERPVTFAGVAFEDPDFAGPYEHGRWLTPALEVREWIAERVRAGL